MYNLFIIIFMVLHFGSNSWAEENRRCENGRKIRDDCNGIDWVGCCEGNVLVFCEKDGKALCAIECDSLPLCGFAEKIKAYDCDTDGLEDPEGKYPKSCKFECSPSCEGKQCGSDGCLGMCPDLCKDGEVCKDNKCISIENLAENPSPKKDKGGCFVGESGFVIWWLPFLLFLIKYIHKY